MAIAFRASATGTGTTTTATITVPTGTTTGDVIFAVVGNPHNGAIPTHTFPGGWTLLDSIGATDANSVGGRCSVAWHAWGAGETSYSVTLSGVSSSSWVTIAASYSGVDPLAPTVAHNINNRTAYNATAVTTPTLTDSTANIWRVSAYYGNAVSANVTWGSYSPADTERADKFGTSTFRASASWADSNAIVDASAGTSVTATPSGSVGDGVGWIGLLKQDFTPVSDSDTGAGVDAATAASATFTKTDTGTGVDAATAASATFITTDVGSALDAGNAPPATFTKADTGSALDAGTAPPATFTKTDVGSALDASTILATPSSSADTGVAEDRDQVAFTDAAVWTGTDAENPLEVVTGDVVTVIETGVPGPQYADTGSGADAAISVAFTAPDVGSAAEGMAKGFSAADTAVGAESGAIIATLPSSDTGSGAEGSSISNSITNTDAGVGVDSGVVSVRTFSSADTVQRAEAGVVLAAIASADTAIGAEDITVDGSQVVDSTDVASSVDASLIAATVATDEDRMRTRSILFT